MGPRWRDGKKKTGGTERAHEVKKERHDGRKREINKERETVQSHL